MTVNVLTSKFDYLPKIRCPSRLIKRDTTMGNLSLMAFKRPSGSFASSVSRTAMTVVERGFCVSVSTMPTISPRPYSPTNSFLPSRCVITDRRRPLSTINVQSDSSPCLKFQVKGFKELQLHEGSNSHDYLYKARPLSMYTQSKAKSIWRTKGDNR